MNLYLLGMREATEWAASHGALRVRVRTRDYEAWMLSCNGNHSPEVQERAVGYLDGLKKVLEGKS